MAKSIPFAPPMLNLDRPEWNTIRLGERRFKAGEVVTLKHGKEILGQAEVTQVLVLPLKQATEQHGRFNHNRLDDPPNEAAHNAFSAVRSRYGKKVTEESLVTVIYVRRKV